MQQVPAIVEHWIKEVKNPKNSEFQRDLYRIKLEELIKHIQNELAFSTTIKKK